VPERAERIALVERSSALEERSQAAVETQQKLESERRRSQHWHQPLLESLDFQVQWAREVPTNQCLSHDG